MFIVNLISVLDLIELRVTGTKSDPRTPLIIICDLIPNIKFYRIRN